MDPGDGGPATAETTPLLPAPATSISTPALASAPAPRLEPRSVSFSQNPVTGTTELPSQRRRSSLGRVSPSAPGPAPGPGSYPAFSTGAVNPTMLAALNNRIRRRSSGGSATASALHHAAAGMSKIGPQRSSKTAQKLKLLPDRDVAGDDADEDDEESGREVYSQFMRIKDPTARRDAARLGKADRERLPRVTAYCTANRYAQELMVRFFKGRGKRRGANPKLIDECIYTPYSYSGGGGGGGGGRRRGADREEVARDDVAAPADGATAGLQGQPDGRGVPADLEGGHPADVDGAGGAEGARDGGSSFAGAGGNTPDFDTAVHTSEVFAFDYGVVVVWGMSVAEEQRFLKEMARFEIEPLAADEIETEEFNFYYTREYQPRIYNDFITLRDKHNYMTKLAISHALAQSVKELIASTIDTCKEIPNQISLTGKVTLSRSEINMQIGELFSLRIDIHLNGSVLDTPEVFWVEPHLEPVYQAVRSYLEMDQRAGLLTDRMDVIADLLAVLKDLLSHRHGEKLEWIIIILIAAEIFVALVNIFVDLYVGI